MDNMAITERHTVRTQNDRLRREHHGGTVVVTPGVRALGSELLGHLLTAVAEFDTFTVENDPYGQHDFGSISMQGHCMFFKIDAYDRNLCHHSPDPADPTPTCRVMTLMLAEEY